MVYPLIVMTMAFAIMGFLLVFIVPKFETIFHDMLGDKPLPGVTIFVITVSKVVVNHWLVLIGGIVATFSAYKILARTPRGKTPIHRGIPRLAPLCDLIPQNSNLRFL